MSQPSQSRRAEVAPSQRAEHQYAEVAVSRLDTRFSALRLPDPQAMAAMSRSIERHGVLQPVTVNRLTDGTLVLLDGFKRLSALGDDTDAVVPVRVVVLSEVQAKAALLTFNRAHRGVCELEEAWVVQALVREHELRQSQVAELLGRHKSWVCRRLQLAERLEAGVVDDMRLGLVSASVARELVRLPRGNQLRVAAAVQEHSLTSRQTRELVGRLLSTDDEGSQGALLADPLRYLVQTTPKSSVRGDARLTEAGNRVYRSLVLLDRQASITERVVRSPSNRVDLTARHVLAPKVKETVAAVRVLLDTLIGLGADDA